ncbi:MAG: hypothetical protein J6P83_10155 [Bacteroidales bacterium]|nr:hypothetical protein [Bacteroidales bacterium]
MTNLLGKWRIAETLQFDDETNNMKWTKVEVVLKGEDVDRDTITLLNSIVEFEEGGRMLMLAPIPEGVSQDEIDEAVKAGQIHLKDNRMYFEEQHWKVENGVNYTDTMPEGEVLGEKVGPWEKVTEFEDGTIAFLTYRLARL